jgi:hypothetical protein
VVFKFVVTKGYRNVGRGFTTIRMRVFSQDSVFISWGLPTGLDCCILKPAANGLAYSITLGFLGAEERIMSWALLR